MELPSFGCLWCVDEASDELDTALPIRQIEQEIQVNCSLDLKSTRAFAVGALFVGVTLPAMAAVGDTETWVLDTPAIANAAQNPPYVPVGTVSLLETAAGVQFTLDPNELNPGYQSNAHINQLFYTFTGSQTLTGASFSNLSAALPGTSAPVDSFSVVNNGNEAGYSPLTIQVQWSNSNSGGGALRLEPNETSSWLVSGTTLADFGAVAFANSKPSPVFGVLSVQGFSGDSSNWVAQVPEPETYAAMLVGLVLLAGQVARSRSRSAS